MYRNWANNPKLETSFLVDKEEELLIRWNARLKVDEASLGAEAAKKAAEEAMEKVTEEVADPKSSENPKIIKNLKVAEEENNSRV